MAPKLRYYNAITDSDTWGGDDYEQNILTNATNIPGNVYTTILTGWTAETSA